MHYDQDIFITLAPNQVGAFDEFVKGLTNVQQPDQVIRHKSGAVCYCWLDRDIKDFGMTEDGYEPLLQYLWKLDQMDWSWDEIDDYDSYNMKTWWREGTFYRTAFARKNKLYAPKGHYYDERVVFGITVTGGWTEVSSKSIFGRKFAKERTQTRTGDLKKLGRYIDKHYGSSVEMFNLFYMDQARYWGVKRNITGKLEAATSDMEAELESVCRQKKWAVSKRDIHKIANTSLYQWRMAGEV